MDCPYCKRKADFLASWEFYGKDYGTNVYVCFPCDAYVGTHSNTRTPLGTMAKKELRSLRKQAHAAFDPLWKSRGMSRSEAYRWLQESMGMDPQEAHIGRFNESQCRALLWKLERRRNLTRQ